MPGRTILKWTTLTIVSFVIVMLILRIVHRDTASAASSKPGNRLKVHYRWSTRMVSREPSVR